ncbi:DNA repair protein RecO [Compostibacter hankyongensis]|uniref:DNA repair protein RecO n=1 Tax=Compostibacter hankyongensis TaxID=1007089 RepID=A0ABP8FSP2_9BACT
MLQKTEALVLRTVKYRETSVVATLFTESTGIQAYLVNGVRTAATRSARANLLQPGNLLELVAYHRGSANLQRLSDFRLAHIYRSILLDVTKNAVVLFIVEVLQHSLHQPEPPAELFGFVKAALLTLDEQDTVTANLPLFFLLKLGKQLGFGLEERPASGKVYLDLREGVFVRELPHHPYYLDEEHSRVSLRLLQAADARESAEVAMNQATRRRLLQSYLEYFRLHLPDFGTLRSPAILQEILEG